MCRRSTPERLYQAHRAGTVRRLTLEGELPERAEAWVVAWEREGPRRASSGTAGTGTQAAAGSWLSAEPAPDKDRPVRWGKRRVETRNKRSARRARCASRAHLAMRPVSAVRSGVAAGPRWSRVGRC
jgi:hypothetical protein